MCIPKVGFTHGGFPQSRIDALKTCAFCKSRMDSRWLPARVDTLCAFRKVGWARRKSLLSAKTGWHTNERARLSAKSADCKVVGLDAIVHQTLACLEAGVPKTGPASAVLSSLRFNGFNGWTKSSCSFDDGVADLHFLLFEDKDLTVRYSLLRPMYSHRHLISVWELLYIPRGSGVPCSLRTSQKWLASALTQSITCR